MGQNGGADAMLPEFAPGKVALQGEFLKIFDDRRHECQLPDLTDAEIKNGFLNAGDGRAEAIINLIDQPQEPRGQAGIAPDDFPNLRGITLLREHQTQHGPVDTA